LLKLPSGYSGSFVHRYAGVFETAETVPPPVVPFPNYIQYAPTPVRFSNHLPVHNAEAIPEQSGLTRDSFCTNVRAISDDISNGT
jgi:hypothetical protein